MEIHRKLINGVQLNIITRKGQSLHRNNECLEKAVYIVGSVLFTNVFSGIFARVLFSLRSFVKKKSLRNGEITLSFTDIGKSCPIANI